jgi:ribosomal protein L19
MASIAKNTVKVSPVNMVERADLKITSGDHVIVWQKIVEEVQEGKTTKMKSRLQAFEGDVIATKHGIEAGATFTVRREASGVGVERIFPLYSPSIDKIEIVRRSKVRRAKLYHIRDVASKKMKQTLRKMRLVGISTLGGAELEAIAAKEAAVIKKEEDRIAAEAKVVADAEAKVLADKAAEEKEIADREAAIVAEQAAAEAVKVAADAPAVPAAVELVAEVASADADDIVKWVEGIGPKIGEVFAAAGITTFAQLADADVESLKAILTDNSLASHDPSTWSQQAALARDGKWDELKDLHKALDGGKVAV